MGTCQLRLNLEINPQSILFSGIVSGRGCALSHTVVREQSNSSSEYSATQGAPSLQYVPV